MLKVPYRRKIVGAAEVGTSVEVQPQASAASGCWVEPFQLGRATTLDETPPTPSSYGAEVGPRFAHVCVLMFLPVHPFEITSCSAACAVLVHMTCDIAPGISFTL